MSILIFSLFRIFYRIFLLLFTTYLINSKYEKLNEQFVFLYKNYSKVYKNDFYSLYSYIFISYLFISFLKAFNAGETYFYCSVSISSVPIMPSFSYLTNICSTLKVFYHSLMIWWAYLMFIWKPMIYLNVLMREIIKLLLDWYARHWSLTISFWWIFLNPWQVILWNSWETAQSSHNCMKRTKKISDKVI